jgi:hypothetical protein
MLSLPDLIRQSILIKKNLLMDARVKPAHDAYLKLIAAK